MTKPLPDLAPPHTKQKTQMGPTTLFDKSFLESLNPDKSFWFDHFFQTNVCPIFYVETLADLKKSRNGYTPEQIVSFIANKFPEMHSAPNVHHMAACMGELYGHSVPMTGQILLAGGRPVKSGGKSGIVFDESPEAEAFSRWQRGEYFEIERRFAHKWREMVENIDLKTIANLFKTLGINGKTCKTLEQAKLLAEQIVSSPEKPFDKMHLALVFLNIEEQYHKEILARWSVMNYPPIKRYAPYVAYVLTIELFFQIALAADLIPSDRPSNRLDIAYLFYLPFSMAFVSNDKLHHKCARLFLRQDQQYIEGEKLRAGLEEINEYYLKFPEEQKQKGAMAFAPHPPKEAGFYVAEIWDRHFPEWRNEKEIDISKISHTESSELAEHIIKLTEANALSPDEIDFDLSNPDTFSIQRKVRKMKGSWLQIPNNIKSDDKI